MTISDNTTEPGADSGAVPFAPPDPDLPVADPLESGPEPFSLYHLGILAAGFVAYGLGFFLLARNHPTSAPVIIISGIVTMLASFFV